MLKRLNFRDFLLGVITFEVVSVVMKAFGLDNIWIEIAVMVGIITICYILFNIIQKKKRRM